MRGPRPSGPARRTGSFAGGWIPGRACGGPLSRCDAAFFDGASRLSFLRLSFRRGGRLRGLCGGGARGGAVAKGPRGVGLLHAGGGDLHFEARFAQDLQGLLAGDAPFFRYLVNALLCHSQTNSMVSCWTVTELRNARASGRPSANLFAHCGRSHTYAPRPSARPVGSGRTSPVSSRTSRSSSPLGSERRQPTQRRSGSTTPLPRPRAPRPAGPRPRNP